MRAVGVIADENGRVGGVRTTAGEITARWTLDASGGTHWLARSLGCPFVRRSPDLHIRYGYAAGAVPELRRGPRLDASAKGWTWTAQVTPELVHWARLGLEHRSDDEFPVELVGLAPRGPVRSADVTWRRRTAIAGPGHLALGDAAAVLDPASSHGVLRALISGRAAAAVVSGADPDAYARALCGWFERDAAQLRALYAALPDAPTWVTDDAAAA